MNLAHLGQRVSSIRRFTALAMALAAAGFAARFGNASTCLSSAKGLVDPQLVVHEWGTFTSIAGLDGAAAEWLPLSQKNDLPSFVEHLRNADVKGGLRGTVRMETPVLYFYSPRQTTVSVTVSFVKGLITEWFPNATLVHPSEAFPITLNSEINGAIAWQNVTITPTSSDTLPREAAPRHYYAARETSANLLSVPTSSGNQIEKFLFYRGVSESTPPVAAKVQANGQLQFQNNTQAILTVILFERRGDKLGYTVSSLQSSATLNTPSTSGTFDSLRSDFENALIAQGLYRDEAHAMLETWRDSWFEEGSRLFYIVPRPFVDSVLPLSIHPVPGQLTRVFVGRIELVTPATENIIEIALLRNDREALQKYGRFLATMVEIIAAKHPDTAQTARLKQAFADYCVRLPCSPATRR